MASRENWFAAFALAIATLVAALAGSPAVAQQGPQIPTSGTVTRTVIGPNGEVTTETTRITTDQLQAPVTSDPMDSSAGFTEVVITVLVPDGTPTVYLTGNIRELGPWNPRARALEGTGRERSVRLRLPSRGTFEYKLTLGSWEREGLGPGGQVMDNFRLTPSREASARVTVYGFRQGGDVRRNQNAFMEDVAGSGVLGTLIYWRDVRSAHLRERRTVSIWLPPGYAENPDRRYRVIYMSDGQNLFDPRIANTGTDWGMDEAMVAGMTAGRFEPAIIVGVWNSRRRMEEYSPWHDAPKYARFLIEELMPRVNREFRTQTGPQNTFHMGSSMGGLLSFYLVRNHPGVFSACGCVSTALQLSPAMAAGQGIAGDRLNTKPYFETDFATGVRMPAGQRLFFTFGQQGAEASLAPSHSVMRVFLRQQGLVDGRDFQVRAYPDGDHNEASWRAQAGEQLDWLLGRRP